jgi:hypothetical protein
MRKTYYGYWTTGNSYNGDAYEFTNLKTAKKTMREIAMGNDTGSGARWWIDDNDNVIDERHIAEGFCK